MTDKEIARDITIAIIQKVTLIHASVSGNIDISQAIEKNGEVIAKLYKTIYDEVSSV